MFPNPTSPNMSKLGEKMGPLTSLYVELPTKVDIKRLKIRRRTSNWIRVTSMCTSAILKEHAGSSTKIWMPHTSRIRCLWHCGWMSQFFAWRSIERISFRDGFVLFHLHQPNSHMDIIYLQQLQTWSLGHWHSNRISALSRCCCFI